MHGRGVDTSARGRRRRLTAATCRPAVDSGEGQRDHTYAHDQSEQPGDGSMPGTGSAIRATAAVRSEGPGIALVLVLVVIMLRIAVTTCPVAVVGAAVVALVVGRTDPCTGCVGLR